MLSPLLHAYLHVLIPTEQRIALFFQDTWDAYIHVGQGPEDYVLYYPPPPQMSRFKPFPSMGSSGFPNHVTCSILPGPYFWGGGP